MGTYELIFEAAPPTAEQLDSLYEHEDALVAAHGRAWFITISSNGTSALSAGKSAVGRLEALGIAIWRSYEDLVTRSEIARRAGVTAQAVGLWTRGQRRSIGAPDFPEPFNYAGGGVELWLWGDVNTWLDPLGKADDMSHPSRVDHILINNWLLMRSTGWEVTSSWHLDAG